MRSIRRLYWFFTYSAYWFFIIYLFKEVLAMDEIDCKEIETIFSDVDCPKGFSCLKSGLKNLCEAKDLGLDQFLECMETKPYDCSFAFKYGDCYFCKCEVRFYLSKKYKK